MKVSVIQNNLEVYCRVGTVSAFDRFGSKLNYVELRKFKCLKVDDMELPTFSFTKAITVFFSREPIADKLLLLHQLYH